MVLFFFFVRTVVVKILTALFRSFSTALNCKFDFRFIDSPGIIREKRRKPDFSLARRGGAGILSYKNSIRFIDARFTYKLAAAALCVCAWGGSSGKQLPNAIFVIWLGIFFFPPGISNKARTWDFEGMKKHVPCFKSMWYEWRWGWLTAIAIFDGELVRGRKNFLAVFGISTCSRFIRSTTWN